MDLKNQIILLAESLGFQRTVIASLSPMEKERAEYERWLALGYAADMEYLKRNPHFRTSPLLLVPQSRSAIVVSVSYYTTPPEPPGLFFGKIARYAVGLDYHAVLRAKLRELRAGVEKLSGRPLPGKAFTDDVALFEQGLAARHGLGFKGRHTLIIGPRLMGSFNFVGELITDLELEPDIPYDGTCGKCFRCGEGCPTDAIKYGEGVDANLCISYLTIENKGGIPLPLREKVGLWVFGCDICQNVCPYNQKPPPAPWDEFQPERGAGHYLDLLSLLDVGSEEEFRALFGHTPLRRPRRRGLTRNALVVIGNILSREGSSFDECETTVARLEEFIKNEPDAMLREHAAWAISKAGGGARKILSCMMRSDPSEEVRRALSEYPV